MRSAPSEQSDYVSEGSAADLYKQANKHNTIKYNIYRGVAQLGEVASAVHQAAGLSPATPTKNGTV